MTNTHEEHEAYEGDLLGQLLRNQNTMLDHQESMLKNQSDLRHNQHVIAEKLDDILALLRDNSLVNTQILDRVHAIIS